MLSEKLKVSKSRGRAMKEQKKVLKLMEQFKRNGLLSKELYTKYKTQIEEDVNNIKEIVKQNEK